LRATRKPGARRRLHPSSRPSSAGPGRRDSVCQFGPASRAVRNPGPSCFLGATSRLIDTTSTP
jgi:hypothetical protein